MYLRLLSALTVLIVVAVFLLPSTIAIYTAVNGTAWDLLDGPWVELLVPALVAALALALSISVLLPLLTPEVTHPVSAHARLFQLDCALIC